MLPTLSFLLVLIGVARIVAARVHFVVASNADETFLVVLELAIQSSP